MKPFIFEESEKISFSDFSTWVSIKTLEPKAKGEISTAIGRAMELLDSDSVDLEVLYADDHQGNQNTEFSRLSNLPSFYDFRLNGSPASLVRDRGIVHLRCSFLGEYLIFRKTLKKEFLEIRDHLLGYKEFV